MKLNRAERWFINSPLRRLMQYFVVRWFRQAAGGAGGGRVLEIGCGRGVGAAMIAAHFRPRQLVLSDLDPAMARLAARRTAAAGIPALVLAADAVALPLAAASVDTVFGFGFLHHVPDWRAGLGEIHRVLVPGGTYLFEEYFPALYQNPITRRLLCHPDYDRFDGPQLRQAFAEAGLSLKRGFELKRLGILGVAERPR